MILNLGAVFLPERVLSGKEFASLQEFGAIGGWILVLLSLLGVFYCIWLSRLLWTDIRGLQMNRRLERRYA
jgi:hypothetical protein